MRPFEDAVVCSHKLRRETRLKHRRKTGPFRYSTAEHFVQSFLGVSIGFNQIMVYGSIISVPLFVVAYNFVLPSTKTYIKIVTVL